MVGQECTLAFSLVGPELEAGMKIRRTVSYWLSSDCMGPFITEIVAGGGSVTPSKLMLSTPAFGNGYRGFPKIDAFELWCWRRLLRVPWTARRSVLGVHWKD